MENSLHSISKLFTERLFRIPDYQRGYSWGELQLRDYWNDVIQLESGKNHYTGVITLESVPQMDLAAWREDLWIINSKSFVPYYVVDGQQRLTTTIILINEIALHIGDKKVNYTTSTDIRKKFIFDSKDEGISRSYIFGYEKDNPSYFFLKTKIFGERVPESELNQETVYTKNLEFACEFFRAKLAEIKDFSEIEKIYKVVTQNLLFNIYSISTDIDVHVAFETMNNRGKALTSLELLKNRLIFITSRLPDEEAEKRQLRYSVNECWKYLYHQLGRNKESQLEDESFLAAHYYSYFAPPITFVHSGQSAEDLEEKKVEETTRYYNFIRFYEHQYKDALLNEIFKSREEVPNPAAGFIGLQKINSFVGDLKASSGIWYGLHNPWDMDGISEDERIWIEKLNQLKVNRVRILLVQIYKKSNDPKLRLSFLKVLERFLFISLLAANREYYWQPEMRADHLKNASYLRDGIKSLAEIIDDYNKVIEKNLKEKEFIPGVIGSFKRRGFYEWPGIRYFLFEYEQAIQSSTKAVRKKLIWSTFCESRDDYVTVEHIYPRNARMKEWTDIFGGFTPKQRDGMRHSLGNLLPLSTPKNSSLSNRPFVEKVSGNGDYVGYRFGCLSENEVAEKAIWDPSMILERGIKLLDFMEKRWQLNFGDLSSKTKMLNMEFTKKPG